MKNTVLPLLALGLVLSLGVARGEQPSIQEKKSESPVAEKSGETVQQMAPFLVQERPQLSFFFSVRILKSGITKKVFMMYVDSVKPGSDAEKKGLANNTQILAIDGKPITDFDATFQSGSELNRILVGRKLRSEVKLDIIRPGWKKKQTVTVAYFMALPEPDPRAVSDLP